MMKLVIVAVIISAAYAEETAEEFMCMEGAHADAKLTEKKCDSGVKTCTMPIVKADFTALTDQGYGCGACDSDTTCKTCDKTKCNVKVETETYDCANYAWSTDKYAAPETKTKCMIVKSADAKKTCNMPGDEAKKDGDYVKQNNGCGKCVNEKSVTDKMCKESSAVSMTALLLPLIAAFYTLF